MADCLYGIKPLDKCLLCTRFRKGQNDLLTSLGLHVNVKIEGPYGDKLT